MDFKWSYDQQEPSFFTPHMYDPLNSSYLALVHTTDIAGAHPVDPTLDLSADYVRYYLGNESNGEIDIGTITPPNQMDMEAVQNILTDDPIRSGIKQVDEAILLMKEAEIKPAPSQVEPMDVDGSNKCFAVNNETKESKQKVEQMNKQHQLFPPQKENNSSKTLFELLTLPPEITLPLNIDPKEFQPETKTQVDPNAGKNYVQSSCQPGKVIISDAALVKIAVEKMIEEICSPDAVEMVQDTKKVKEEFPNPARSKRKARSFSVQSELVPIPPRPTQSTEEFSCDVVSLSPSNPESALQPVTSDAEIGPFCTAAGIFANVFNLIDLPENRKKLSAEELKNGIVFEMHSRFLQIYKRPRKIFAKLLSLLFDIQLDWENPGVVSRLFGKAINPMLAERADLIRCFSVTVTRRASSRGRATKENDPQQQINQFDAAVFVLPLDGFEELNPFPKRIKSKSKVFKNAIGEDKSATTKYRKLTQGQQLLELQTRFDAFRRSQRKHNAAFLRHIFLIQRELECAKRSTSKRLLQSRRRSMPNPSVLIVQKN
uniref:Uncharacterized protein n=1 Tax=Daphnia galeata TaxID=27404 RepID=A0A8J2RHM9_9CRUS|nr:unnamed protein product [Daphnia galeata]